MAISHLVINDSLQNRIFLPLSLFRFGFKIQLDESFLVCQASLKKNLCVKMLISLKQK